MEYLDTLFATIASFILMLALTIPLCHCAGRPDCDGLPSAGSSSGGDAQTICVICLFGRVTACVSQLLGPCQRSGCFQNGRPGVLAHIASCIAA